MKLIGAYHPSIPLLLLFFQEKYFLKQIILSFNTRKKYNYKIIGRYALFYSIKISTNNTRNKVLDLNNMYYNKLWNQMKFIENDILLQRFFYINVKKRNIKFIIFLVGGCKERLIKHLRKKI